MLNEPMDTATALEVAILNLEQMEKEIEQLTMDNQNLKKSLSREYQANSRLRKEMAYLEKEREMLWKTVDRMTGAENRGDS